MVALLSHDFNGFGSIQPTKITVYFYTSGETRTKSLSNAPLHLNIAWIVLENEQETKVELFSRIWENLEPQFWDSWLNRFHWFLLQLKDMLFLFLKMGLLLILDHFIMEKSQWENIANKKLVTKNIHLRMKILTWTFSNFDRRFLHDEMLKNQK